MAMRRPGRRFDVVEVLLVGALAAAIGGWLGSTITARRLARVAYVAYSAAQEQDTLKARYGPTKFSRNEEEWVVRDYFQDRRDGVFVDIGANHYRQDSNTFYLESVLGWSGLAVEPQSWFAEGYRVHRPRTRFAAFFVSDTSDASVTLYQVPENPLVASADRGFAERAGTAAKDPMHASTPVTVPTVRLTDLLDRLGIARFDFLSIDVELAEPKVLAGFDIDRFQPALVCIEAHPAVRQQILDYFAAHGYRLLGRYLRADLQNLYFEPGPGAGRPEKAPGAGGTGEPSR
jgi:FkbM family methyltransferase